jgi:hypothetical protein
MPGISKDDLDSSSQNLCDFYCPMFYRVRFREINLSKRHRSQWRSRLSEILHVKLAIKNWFGLELNLSMLSKDVPAMLSKCCAHSGSFYNAYPLGILLSLLLTEPHFYSGLWCPCESGEWISPSRLIFIGRNPEGRL